MFSKVGQIHNFRVVTPTRQCGYILGGTGKLLSKKLALAAAIISVISIGIASFASLQISSSALRKKSVANFEAVADGRRNHLETYLANVELDASSLAQSALATTALHTLTMNWQVIPGDPGAELHRRYITENPNTESERDKLDNPKIDSYDVAHGRFDAKFRAIVEGRGYWGGTFWPGSNRNPEYVLTQDVVCRHTRKAGEKLVATGTLRPDRPLADHSQLAVSP
ncbi:hypothetical protein [Agrobacterium tumefaciens]|uniref:hypothetical protein n=1 Tax=Agrobacterium tumefaciens TaxID=358 RepID=UPI003BA1F071